jgi:hypothetical protein
VVRLAKNHPLPDGNKRAGWVSLRAFIELNDWSWATYPSIDEAGQAVVAIASGEWDEARIASGLRVGIEGPARGEGADRPIVKPTPTLGSVARARRTAGQFVTARRPALGGRDSRLVT